jgi:hypothetical protein
MTIQSRPRHQAVPPSPISNAPAPEPERLAIRPPSSGAPVYRSSGGPTVSACGRLWPEVPR